MTVAAFVLALAALFAAAIAVSVAGVRWGSSLSSLERRRVIVTLKDGQSFAGVLFKASREALMVRNAELLAAGQRAVPVDGEVLVLRADVLYVQFP